jgi:orotate phosphoribosyltransferase
VKNELIKILISKSVKIANTPEFKLVSGKTSKIYIDCKKTTCNAKGKVLIGNLLFDRISNLDVNAIGGLTLGADPIASAVSYASEIEKKPINAFIVRKKAKKHGLKKTIEGDVKKGDKVVVVDDVITTGASTIEAIEKAREFGLCVVKAVVLVDRHEGGKENIEKTGVPCEAIVTKTELLANSIGEKSGTRD